MGVVVIDIGGGTTDLAIFIEGTVWHVAVIAVGGDLLTNDITHWMHVPFDEAEVVKIQHGHAQRRAVNLMETFTVQPFGEGMPTEVHRNELAEVLEYRTIETFELVQREIKRSGYDGLLRAGAVITGGSSQLPGIQDVAEATLNFPVRLAKPERMTGMADALRSPSYSTSVGLLGLGLEMDTVDGGGYRNGHPTSGINLGNILGGFFRRLLPDDGA
jgi:cell division protein FtsA